MQEIFDKLYADSKQDKIFKNLYELIVSKNNILLAYRSIKSNKGSNTAGVNGTTINNWKITEADNYIEYVRKRLQNYHPHKVKRVEIPKQDGRTRPLGIPTMEDRLIQQCIKQVLEPILEAKFYPLSFGFRPNRSTMHAISEFTRMVNLSHLYYVIDVDIKGFFDNVNHAKLLKQLWSLGIQDKRIISIIGKMLNAEIEGIGKPTKGTPQGGILSPLLANVVLNELDWWVDSQWKSFTAKEIKVLVRTTKHGSHEDKSNTYAKLRQSTNLKEMHIVRYADDFKILCRNQDDALKTYEAVKQWLSQRLSLEVSEEKSQVIDIRKKSSKFLGFRFKAKVKGDKTVINSHMLDKAMDKVTTDIKTRIVAIKEKPTIQNVLKYNSVVMGVQNYYNIATHINLDFNKLEYNLRKFRYNQLRPVMTEKGKTGKTYNERYKGYNFRKQFVAGFCLYPIPAIKHQKPTGFSQNICNYTVEGREKIHKNLRINVELLHYLMENPLPNHSTELADNRISLYSAQWGKCGVTGEELHIGNMEVHHKIPKHLGGTDEYKNLIWVTSDVHELIHATVMETINKYLERVKPKAEALEKINKLRKNAGNCVIEQNES